MWKSMCVFVFGATAIIIIIEGLWVLAFPFSVMLVFIVQLLKLLVKNATRAELMRDFLLDPSAHMDKELKEILLEELEKFKTFK